MNDAKLHLIGYASGVAGADAGCSDGPIVLRKSPFFAELNEAKIIPIWDTMIAPLPSDAALPIDEVVKNLSEKLATKTSQLVCNKQFFTVLGGDHTSAVGTWSGVYDALHHQGELGLIWIDAHMDSHTPETTETGNIHGMPLASLMGYGYRTLATILNVAPKLKPENICLIGVRSFERGEAELLKRLNVRVYFMNEVKDRGFAQVLQEAVDIVTRHTIGYGISFDLDALDPKDAPGVDVPEPDGISASEMYQGITPVISHPSLLGIEIVEFDPSRDRDHLTEKLIATLVKKIAKERN